MHVLMTGGTGFLGGRLARALLERGWLTGADGQPHSIDRLTILDVAPGAPIADARVTSVTGDIADPALLDRLIDADTTSVFHLAAIVSGMAEAEFEKGMRVNLDATRALLDICRARGHRPRFVFVSSCAVYGGTLPGLVPASIELTPQTSYGTQKAIGELLVNDYSRRGFVDGRSVRLPTITVRAGKPNAAASSFASGIIREPLNGEIAICPVGPDTRVWVASPRAAIDGLITAHELASESFGTNRAFALPGLSLTVGEMVAALERVAGAEAVGRIRWEPDPRITPIVLGWPAEIDTTRAEALGFVRDTSFEDIVRSYVQEL